MPHLTYDTIAALIDAQHTINSSGTIPKNLSVEDISHLLVFPNHTTIRSLVKKDLDLLVPVIHHRLQQSMDNGSKTEKECQTWCYQIMAEHLTQWITDKKIAPVWAPILPVLRSLNIPYPLDNHALKKTITQSNDPHYLAFVFLSLSDSVLTRSGIYPINEHLNQSLNDNDLITFLSYFSEKGSFPSFICSETLIERIEKIFSQTIYTIKEYNKLTSLLSTLNVLPKITVKKYDKSFHELEKSLEDSVEYFKAYNKRYMIAKSILAFKDIKSLTSEDIQWCFQHALVNTFVVELSQLFDQFEQPIQTDFFKYTHQYKQNYFAHTFNPKSFFLEKMMGNHNFAHSLSPIFAQIERSETITNTNSAPYLEPYIRAWLKKYQPDFMNTMKMLGVTRMKELIQQYQKTTRPDLIEAEIHLG